MDDVIGEDDGDVNDDGGGGGGGGGVGANTVSIGDAAERVVAARVMRDDDEDDTASDATHRVNVTFVRDDDDAGDHEASTVTGDADAAIVEQRSLERAVWRAVLRVCDDDDGDGDEDNQYAFEGDTGDNTAVGGDGDVDDALPVTRLNHESASDVEAFRLLLESAKTLNLNVDAKSDDGDGALHLASLYGKTSFVKELIAAGATVEVRDEAGGTPLHDACASGHLAIVHELCLAATKNGTITEYIRMTDEDGEQCLHLAARGEHHEIVSYLLENGADARSMNSQGHTPADVCEDESLRDVLRNAATP